MEELADPTSTARHFISEPQFIDPMLLLRTDSLPPGEQWLYELKLDGYRVIAFKRNGDVQVSPGRRFNARRTSSALSVAAARRIQTRSLQRSPSASGHTSTAYRCTPARARMPGTHGRA